MNQHTGRINWLDFAKGIGIILVVLGHAILPTEYAIWIFSFHMPLFFFLSGYLFSENKFKTLNLFIKRKASTLLIPYFSFSLLSFVYFSILINNIGSEHVNIMKPFIGIFYSVGINNWMVHNTPLWFLTCLFIVEILFYLIVRKLSSKKGLLFVLIASSIIGYIDSLYMPIRLPWGIDIAFSSIVFFGLGYLFKKIAIVEKFVFDKKFLFLFIGLLLNMFFVLNMIKDNYKIDMNLNKLNHYYDFYLPAISGILLIICISSLIKSSKFLGFIGKNSLIIMATHAPLLTLVRKALSITGIFQNNSLIYSLVQTIITMIVLMPVIYIINRYLPFILGKRKQAPALPALEKTSKAL